MKQIKKILGIALLACTLSVAETATSEAKSVTDTKEATQVSVRIGTQPRRGYYARRRMERQRYWRMRRHQEWRRQHRMYRRY